MRKKIIISVLCFFSIVFFGCKKSTQRADVDLDRTVTISATSIEEVFADTSYFGKPQIIVLETLEESLLSEMSRIAIANNNLFIFDKNLMNILIFDITGKYINKIDRIGQGPEEYLQISDFALDTNKEQIILLCDVPNKLMYFAYNGDFVKEESLNAYYMQLVTDSEYVYFEKMNNIETNGSQLAMLNTETGIVQEGIEVIDIKNYFFIKGNSLSKGDDILYVRRYDNSIYGIKNGEIEQRYTVDFGKYTFPDRLIEEESTERILKECHENEYIFSMADAINNDHYIMFKTNLGLFIYDKSKDILKGYKQMLNTKVANLFPTYLILENTDKIVFSIDDPSFIKHAVKRIPDEMKTDNKYSEILEIADKLTDENNPVLFIYEFKD